MQGFQEFPQKRNSETQKLTRNKNLASLRWHKITKAGKITYPNNWRLSIMATVEMAAASQR